MLVLFPYDLLINNQIKSIGESGKFQIFVVKNNTENKYFAINNFRPLNNG